MSSWLSTMMGQQTHHSMDIVPALRRVGQGQKPSTWWYGVSKVSGPAQWAPIQSHTSERNVLKIKKAL